jgi:hypothetical protein
MRNFDVLSEGLRREVTIVMVLTFNYTNKLFPCDFQRRSFKVIRKPA